MTRTRPLTIPAARFHSQGADWSTRPSPQSAVRREQVHGELQPMEVRPESWCTSLVAALIVAAVFVLGCAL